MNVIIAITDAHCTISQWDPKRSVLIKITNLSPEQAVAVKQAIESAYHLGRLDEYTDCLQRIEKRT